MRLNRLLLMFAAMPTLSACVSAGSGPILVPDASASRPAPAPTPSVSRPAPQPIPQSNPLPAGSGNFVEPQIMRAPGLEGVIGAGPNQLLQRFGNPQLDLIEGDARKLQFAGEACVLDVFLYPTRPGNDPVATHVEARRASDGRNVDRAACVRALSRR